MGDYENEMRRLQALWDEVQNDDEEVIESDGESDIENASEHSDYPDFEQEANELEEELGNAQDNPAVAEDLDDNAIIEGESVEEKKNYYLSKDGTKWRKQCWAKNVRTRADNLIMQLPGVKKSAKDKKSVLECFLLFINEEMIDDMVRWTNQRIEEKTREWEESSYYKPTTNIELKAALGLLYLAGVFRNNHRLIRDFWKTDGTGFEIFRVTMAQRRFEFLLTCWRFDNKENRLQRRQIDKLAPIRAIVDKFTENCKGAYSPSEYLTVDEKLEAFRGRCSFRQYLPNKPNKYGIKVQALVDARTHYLLNMEVYVGKQPDGPFQVSNSPSDIVERLILPYSGSCRNITCDNWYTSYDLFEKLRVNHSLTAVGTIRKNKKELPKSFLVTRNRAIKSSLFGFQANFTIVSYVPKKNKVVLLMSTLHHDDSVNDSENKLPEIISFYNFTKGGVDIVDELSATYNVSRNSKRWPLTLFFSLMNTAGINSQIIFRENNNGIKIKRKDYLTDLGFQLINDYQKERIYNFRIPREIRMALLKIRGETEQPPAKKQKHNKQRRCDYCPRSRDRKTKFSCEGCEKSLCLMEHARIYCENCAYFANE